MSDDKTLLELGIIGGGSCEDTGDLLLKVTIDTSLIRVRVNLNHSMHQNRPSVNNNSRI